MNRILSLLAASLLFAAAALAGREGDRGRRSAGRRSARPHRAARRRRRARAGEVIDDAKDATNAAIEAAKQAILKAIDEAKENTGAKLDEGKKASEDALDKAHEATKLLDKAAEAAREVLDKAKQATSEVFDKAKDAADELSKGPRSRPRPHLRRTTVRQMKGARAMCASPSQIHKSGTNGSAASRRRSRRRWPAASRPAEASARPEPERGRRSGRSRRGFGGRRRSRSLDGGRRRGRLGQRRVDVDDTGTRWRPG